MMGVTPKLNGKILFSCTNELKRAVLDKVEELRKEGYEAYICDVVSMAIHNFLGLAPYQLRKFSDSYRCEQKQPPAPTPTKEDGNGAKDVCSAQDIATLLGVHVSSVYDMTCRKVDPLPCKKIGARIRVYSLREVVEWADKHKP